MLDTLDYAQGLDADELTLWINDYDDEGTLYTITGRGEPRATYCVLTVRACLLARMTADERAEARRWNEQPEYAVRRIVADRGEYGDPDRTTTRS